MAKRKVGAENGNPEPDPVARLEAATARPEPDLSEEGAALREIAAAEKAVEKAHHEFEFSKGQTAALKKQWEARVQELQQTIRELTAPPLPLFDKPKGEAKGTAAGGDDEWRTVPLSKLDIADTILGHLTEAGLETVGQLADFTAGNKRLTDIKGVGESKAEQIEQALDQFWSKRKADHSWRDVRLSAFLPASIVEAIGTDGIETMGGLWVWLEDRGIESLPLSRDGIETLASGVRRFWQERGGVEQSGFKLEWLDLDSEESESTDEEGDEEPEAEPEEKPKRGRKARASN